MDSCDLTQKKCKPCEGGIPPITGEAARKLLGDLKRWELVGDKIEKSYELNDFVEAIDFVNQVAQLAEEEGHHPDVLVYSYRKVKITLWTHAIGGLSENDFIVAAKIDQIRS